MQTFQTLGRLCPQKIRRASPLLLGQVLLFLGFVGTVALTPPARGPMLLVPLRGDTSGAINRALAHGASLLAAGPLPGSIVVTGDRDALASALIAEGTLVIAASPALCGVLPSSGDAP